jgi:predicted ferric reductase
MTDNTHNYHVNSMTELPLKTFGLGLLAAAAGALMAAVLLPNWLPGMTSSIAMDAKVYWYISRGSAIAAYALLWVSLVMGLLMTNKLSRWFPGAPQAYDLHQFVSLAGMFFIALHALILMGDAYISYNLLQVLLPFASQQYKPLYVGLGQLGFYLWLGLVGSFYIRKRLGQRTWRLLHYAGFVAYLFALVHGVSSGSDTATPWMQGVYWVTGGILTFLVVLRFLNAIIKRIISPAQTSKG